MSPLDDFLERIYSAVPDLGCKGLCASVCHESIPVYGRELERLVDRLGPVPLSRADHAVCPYLDGERCSIYDLRPLVCRMHGAIDPEAAAEHEVPIWVCPHGCRPEEWMAPDLVLAMTQALDPYTVRSLDHVVDHHLQQLRGKGVRIWGFVNLPDHQVAVLADGQEERR